MNLHTDSPRTDARTVILANGRFPRHPVPLDVLDRAETRVCCDGAANKLIAAGRTPDVIIGDLDSITPAIREQFRDRLVEDPDQETNDLTKAVHWCLHRQIPAVTILGATGGREDHSLANIALLARYNRALHAEMISDYGIFTVLHASGTLASRPGQQVSLFALTPYTEITSAGLKYPLRQRTLPELWEGSLNEAQGETFTLSFTTGTLIVYRLFFTRDRC